MALALHLLRHARHGHPPDMLCGRMEGVSLGQDGRRQAARLALRFPFGTLDALYTSPVWRCRQTATAIGALEPMVEPASAEVDFGAWTGRSFSVLDADPHWHEWNSNRDEAAAPGGESMHEVRGRVVAMLDALCRRHAEERVAVVTHAEIIRTAVLHLLGLPLREFHRIEIDPASVTTLLLWPGGGRLLGLNDISHLAVPEPEAEDA